MTDEIWHSHPLIFTQTKAGGPSVEKVIDPEAQGHTAEIIRLDIPTLVAHEPDYILEAAKGQGFQAVVVIGLLPDKEAYIAASTSDIERVCFLMEIAKAQFMDIIRAGLGDSHHGR